MMEYEPATSEEVTKFVANNRHNHTVTTYYLLLKRKLKLGIFSSFDICSPIFDRTLLISKTEGAASTNASFTSTNKSLTKSDQR